MGLDISIKVNSERVFDFDGRCTFNPLRDYMVEKYNYEYGTDFKLNKTIIKDMIKFLMNQCFKDNDTCMVSWRMSHVSALMACYAMLNEKPKTIITWECDW